MSDKPLYELPDEFTEIDEDVKAFIVELVNLLQKQKGIHVDAKLYIMDDVNKTLREFGYIRPGYSSVGGVRDRYVKTHFCKENENDR